MSGIPDTHRFTKLEIAPVGMLLADDDPEESGFTGAIRANNADQAAAGQRE